MIRKITAHRLKSDDTKPNDESADWIIVRLNSKIKAAEIKYSDLLSRIHKFIADMKKYLEPVIPTLDDRDQQRLNNDINYFLNTQNSLYSNTLFINFKNEILEKLNSENFSKETFKNYFVGLLNDLIQGLGIKENFEKKKNFSFLESFESFNHKKEINPVRNSKRSGSPFDKALYNNQKEIQDLRASLAEVSKQRDLLKA